MAHRPSPQPEPEYEPEDASSASRASGDLIGRTLEGRYRFDALLGEGTFARVFRVYDLNRRVYLAAKVLRSDIAHEPMFLERFRREATVLQRLQHPNIVRYYDIIESGDTVFILTDHITGQTLQSVLRRHSGPLTPVESLVYLRPLVAALYYAHGEGVIHRDLKPANILLDESHDLYVTDYGIAKLLTDTSTLTVDATVGTPHYMSPEQIFIGEITAATDIYALGVMLYQMYTGQLPFTGDSPEASGTTTAVRIAFEHLHVKPVPPSQLNPSLSERVEHVILRCLEKDPSQRYGSVDEVYNALVAAIGVPAAAPGETFAQVLPEAQRVPTGVGGVSQVVTEDELAPGEDEIEEVTGKRKRDTRRATQKAKRDARRSDETMGEKDREKERESEEKKQEKEQEKGTQAAGEKGEFFSDLGSPDRVGQAVLGGGVIWAGVVLLLELANAGAWIASGVGALALAGVAVRLAVPEYRRRIGSGLVIGTVLLTLGVGSLLNLPSLWPVILIAVGISMLIRRMVEE